MSHSLVFLAAGVLLGSTLPPASPVVAFMSYPGGPRSVGTVGDIDGDGRSDLLIALPTRTQRPVGQGIVYVLSGLDARVLTRVDSPSRSLLFGTSACGTGDLDGDGARDFLVGAPAESSPDPSQAEPGRVFAYSSRTGRLLFQVEGRTSGDRLGYEVARAGEIDRDGVEDFLAGAPGANRAYLFSGRDGALLRELRGSDRMDDELGTSVAGIGDVDCDSIPDVAVGAIGPRGSPGHVFVFSGADGGVLHTLGLEGCFSPSYGCRFGISIDSAGDFDRDGCPDLLVGADQAGADGDGRAFVISGCTGRRLKEWRGTEVLFSRFGTSVALVSDLDGDRAPDYIVANSDDDMDFLRGQAPGSVQAFSSRSGRPLWQVFGDRSHDLLGSSVAAAGDVDGDGTGDVISRNGPARWVAGLSYVRVYSGVDGSLLLDVALPPGESRTK